MRLRTVAFALVLPFTLLTTTLPAQQNEEAIAKAVGAAEAWLQLVDRGELDESWESASSLSRKMVTREQWAQQIGAVRDAMGKHIWRKIELTKFETSLPGAPDGEYVVIQFKSMFENKEDAVETVVPMKDTDGEWRVSGYFIK